MRLKFYIPIFLFVTISAAFVAGQLAYDDINMAAGLTDGEKKAQAHYEAVFKDMSFETTTGEHIQLENVQSPIVILNFWASWCTPCLAEFPSLNELVEKFPNDQLLVVGINTDVSKQKQKIKKIQDKYQLNFPIVADENNDIIDQFLVQAIPVSIIYHKGKVVEVSNGQKDFSSSSFIRKLNALASGS